MDESSQKELQRILTLHETELLPEDLEFVKARRDYLTRTQRKDYSEIFAELGREDGDVFLERLDSAQLSDELRPRKTAKATQYQDKDTRLNLDQPAAAQQVAPQQPAQQTQPAQQPAPQVPQAPAEQTAPQQPAAADEVDHSLDPDFQGNTNQ